MLPRPGKPETTVLLGTPRCIHLRQGAEGGIAGLEQADLDSQLPFLAAHSGATELPHKQIDWTLQIIPFSNSNTSDVSQNS